MTSMNDKIDLYEPWILAMVLFIMSSVVVF